ncbi:NTP transferase domain-containing protein [Agromyces sp. LHK192]|uniref:NTP transferase domain-containing protein n=1 Tax=Agromyces sp. LHK192 TaxID=2498704 RepID=UPI000FDA9F71|nr:NTP transferase domain-containing protein [Agromyces sp. LHK192]
MAAATHTTGADTTGTDKTGTDPSATDPTGTDPTGTTATGAAASRSAATGGLDAIVLAGGRAERLGGVDKGRLHVGGTALVDRVVAAAASAGAARIVVAGPRPASGAAADGADLRHVVDDPPFGGPLAGLAAALDETDAPLVLVLACDLPFAEASVAELAARISAAREADGAVLVDDDGRAQWLFAAYRRDALAAGVARLGDVRDLPVRALVGALDLVEVPATGDSALDVDRWGDLARASTIAAGGVSSSSSVSEPGGRPMSESTPATPEVLDDWVAALSARLGIEATDVPVGTLLDLTRDVAHAVTRPAGPLTTFLVGYAAGRTGDLDGAVAQAEALAAEWGAR